MDGSAEFRTNTAQIEIELGLSLAIALIAVLNTIQKLSSIAVVNTQAAAELGQAQQNRDKAGINWLIAG